MMGIFDTYVLGIMGLAIVIIGADLQARPAGDVTGKVATEQLAELRGSVVSLDGDSLTLGTTEDGRKVQKKLTLAKDVAITLTPDKKGDINPGQRTDVAPGLGVTLSLSADGTTVQAIQVGGRTVHGGISAVDANSITITTKTKDGPKEEKFTLSPSTVVVLSHGKEKGDEQKGTMDDLKAGMSVLVSLSAVDKATVRQVSVQPVAPNPKTGK